MPDTKPVASQEAAPERRTMRFQRKSAADRLAPELAERQGRIARIAFQQLGREGATAFLNTHDAELGGRPLDLAIASPQGFAAVEAAINAQAAG